MNKMLIQAQPGFYWSCGYSKTIDGVDVMKEPIIAWWVFDDECEAPIPVTTHSRRDDGFIIEPDGRVREVREREGAWVSVQDWLLAWQGE